MSIKTLSKKMLAIVAAGAMTMGLAMPVFAEGAGTTNIAKEAYISKTFNTEVGKNETFSFQAKQVTGDTAEVTIPDINFTDSETGSKTKEQIADDSTSWGNYNNATFEYVNSSGSTVTKNENSGTKIPTGNTEYTKANNIYDLAGNVYDWTMEAGSAYYRVCRGGYYDFNGDYSPADSRSSSYPTYSVSNFGCRSALYIK